MSISENRATISLRVYPNASRNELMGFTGEAIRVKVSAPPSQGKANRELIIFLSRLLGLGRDKINITKGHASRNKVVTIEGLSWEEVMELLSPKHLSSGDAATR